MVAHFQNRRKKLPLILSNKINANEPLKSKLKKNFGIFCLNFILSLKIMFKLRRDWKKLTFSSAFQENNVGQYQQFLSKTTTTNFPYWNHFHSLVGHLHLLALCLRQKIIENNYCKKWTAENFFCRKLQWPPQFLTTR